MGALSTNSIENAELREKIFTCSLRTSDLNTKVKNLEYEIEGLLMAIKLQQEFKKSLRKKPQMQNWQSVSSPEQRDQNSEHRHQTSIL